MNWIRDFGKKAPHTAGTGKESVASSKTKGSNKAYCFPDVSFLTLADIITGMSNTSICSASNDSIIVSGKTSLEGQLLRVDLKTGDVRLETTTNFNIGIARAVEILRPIKRDGYARYLFVDDRGNLFKVREGEPFLATPTAFQNTNSYSSHFLSTSSSHLVPFGPGLLLEYQHRKGAYHFSRLFNNITGIFPIDDNFCYITSENGSRISVYNLRSRKVLTSKKGSIQAAENENIDTYSVFGFVCALYIADINVTALLFSDRKGMQISLHNKSLRKTYGRIFTESFSPNLMEVVYINNAWHMIFIPSMEPSIKAYRIELAQDEQGEIYPYVQSVGINISLDLKKGKVVDACVRNHNELILALNDGIIRRLVPNVPCHPQGSCYKVDHVYPMIKDEKEDNMEASKPTPKPKLK